MEAGSVDGQDLAGVRFLITFELGEWTRIYVDEALTRAQRQAFNAVLPLAFGGFARVKGEA